MAPDIVPSAVLLCVLRAGPDYGRHLVVRIAALAPLRLTFSRGTLFPALRRLEAAGLVRAKTQALEAGRGGRPRRVYTLTPKGRRRAEQYAAFFRAVSEVA